MKIIICFDGSGQDPNDAIQKPSQNPATPGEREDDNISNILKLHFYSGGVLGNEISHIHGQHSLYYSGVGTRGKSLVIKNLRMAFALKAPEIIREEAREDLKRLFKPGDGLYIFGYSRGAATARQFAVELSREGLEIASGVKVKPRIILLGCFDTVVAEGAPDLLKVESTTSNGVYEQKTVASNVQRAVHCVALDEKRYLFRPTLMNEDNRVNQVWFAGSHGDVGGGFLKDGLSNIALAYMMGQARQAGLVFVERVRKSALVDPDTGASPVEEDDLRIESLDPQQPYHKSSKKFPYTAFGGMYRERRAVVKMREDEPVKVGPVLIHSSVVERIKTLPDYRPSNLKDVRHQVVKMDGTILPTLYFGLEDHLKNTEEVLDDGAKNLGRMPLKDMKNRQPGVLVFNPNLKR